MLFTFRCSTLAQLFVVFGPFLASSKHSTDFGCNVQVVFCIYTKIYAVIGDGRFVRFVWGMERGCLFAAVPGCGQSIYSLPQLRLIMSKNVQGIIFYIESKKTIFSIKLLILNFLQCQLFYINNARMVILYFKKSVIQAVLAANKLNRNSRASQEWSVSSLS